MLAKTLDEGVNGMVGVSSSLSLKLVDGDGSGASDPWKKRVIFC